MPDPTDEIQADDAVADDAVEQPAEPAREEEPAREKKRARRARMNWRAFVAENVRLLVGLILLATGIVLVILGWYGAAHTNIATEQVPYLISGGLLGLGLIVVGGVMMAGASQERSTDDLRRDIARAMAAMGSRAPDPGVRSDAFSQNGHHVYVVPGGRSYHVAGCPILEGKEGVKELQPAQAASSGYAACKLCGGD